MHQDTIRHAIASILRQSVQDFEILVVGDGAPKRTRDIVEEMGVADRRIKYFQFAKGLAHGELARHEVIAQAKGEYIAYLGDDDIWLPSHLEVVGNYLEVYDFVNTVQLTVTKNDHWHFYLGNLEDIHCRNKMLGSKFNFFGPSAAAHRKDSYFRLPMGWRPKPEGMWSDLHMWRQWLTHKEMRMKSIAEVTAIHLSDKERLNDSIEDRCQEMLLWLDNIKSDSFMERIDAKHKEYWRDRAMQGIAFKGLSAVIDRLFDSGLYEEAYELCNAVNESTTAFLKTTLKGLACLIKIGELSKAECLLETAMTVHRDAPAVYNYGFSIYMASNKFDDAVRVLEKAFALGLESDQLYKNMSRAEECRNNYSQALFYMMKVSHSGLNRHAEKRIEFLEGKVSACEKEWVDK
ncbi:hypothetical protein C4K68_01010 [Pokkaliibacter plantistimulans]|uniref:Glycosyltransferase 2-like domain-containing protein n=2 Tax=Pseudomonadota TaxID=1224 RepID=A0A2S5KX83_9PROT|nr:hypothetical protein C4K68_01010 [Pokkaliibacter plantistimulans]